MARIFFALAVIAVLLLLSNVVVGFTFGDLGESSREYEAARRAAYENAEKRAMSRVDLKRFEAEKELRLQALQRVQAGFKPHFWLGIISALITILVNCISVTYFIGTSRWCQEVVTAYGLVDEYALKSRRLKRRSFPFAFLGICTMLAIVSLGAAADPGASLDSPASWVMPHLITALLGTAVIAVAFYFQAVAVGENFELIDQIMTAAEQARIAAQQGSLVEELTD